MTARAWRDFHGLARLKGLEPLTRSLEGCRSIQLSYRRTVGRTSRRVDRSILEYLARDGDATTHGPFALPAWIDVLEPRSGGRVGCDDYTNGIVTV